jgi:hypothetical protein
MFGPSLHFHGSVCALQSLFVCPNLIQYLNMSFMELAGLGYYARVASSRNLKLCISC